MDLGGLDIRAGSLVASFFGAAAYAVVMKIKRPWDLIGVLIVGLGSSVFIGPLLANWLGEHVFAHLAEDSLQNASGFLMGLSGMVVCNGSIAVARRAMVMLGQRAANGGGEKE